jgi:hypothetical protein
MSAKAKSTPKKTTATATKDVVYVDVDDEIDNAINEISRNIIAPIITINTFFMLSPS